MIVRVLVHLLQLAMFQVLAGAFKSTVDFHTFDLVTLFINGVKGIFSGVTGMFSKRGPVEMAA